jgi:hypothetical protein
MDAPSAEDRMIASQILSPPLMQLFERQRGSEQAHSLRLCRQLLEHKDNQPDLLVAALLHDVGKSRYPLFIWERVWIVLGKALFPERVKKWGQASPHGWRRAFVIAEKHPAWGAEMAAQAGASPLAVALIRRHQTRLKGEALSPEDRLLQRLQLFDDEK